MPETICGKRTKLTKGNQMRQMNGIKLNATDILMSQVKDAYVEGARRACSNFDRDTELVFSLFCNALSRRNKTGRIGFANEDDFDPIEIDDLCDSALHLMSRKWIRKYAGKPHFVFISYFNGISGGIRAVEQIIATAERRSEKFAKRNIRRGRVNMGKSTLPRDVQSKNEVSEAQFV